MMKSIVSSAALTLAIALPATASAQGATSGACPPGSWFCAQAPQQQATPAGQPVQSLQPLPDPDGSGPRTTPQTESSEAESSGSAAVPPPVVYRAPPPPVVAVRPEFPPPYEYAPPAREPISHRQEWGLNLHFEGATIGHGTAGNASMGGGGLGLRFKPSRYFGVETDLDFVGGRDYQGDDRNETAFTVNGLVFLNPRSRAQLYLLAGFGWSAAHVVSSTFDQHYGYFGGQIGGGLELRLSRYFALNVDLRGFIRDRSDQLAQSQPEFTNANGQTTNTSGGGLFTGGMTIYF